MPLPVVSVIIPNYNHAAYLKQRIQSVLEQTFQNFELIILDDCSTDNSKDIIEEYRNHPKVKHIIYNDVNSGSTFKQWNKGVKLAEAPYIWIAESDDYADERFLEICLKELYNNSDLGIVYTDSYEIDKNNKILRKWSSWQELLSNNLWKNEFTENGLIINARYTYLLNIIPNASCAVFKKKIYTNSQSMNQIENLRFTGDWRMWFCILQASDIHYCHIPLNFFRYHSNTTRSNYRVKLQNVLEQYQTISILKKMTAINGEIHDTEKRFSELFEMWNLPIKHLCNKAHFKIFIIALKIDKKLFYRMLLLVLKRLAVT